jgi:hypothetical protein
MSTGKLYSQKMQIWNAYLQPPAHTGSSFVEFSTLKMEVTRSSETSVHTISTERYIPEGGILHSHRRENLKSYNGMNSLFFSRVGNLAAFGSLLQNKFSMKELIVKQKPRYEKNHKQNLQYIAQLRFVLHSKSDQF